MVIINDYNTMLSFGIYGVQ